LIVTDYELDVKIKKINIITTCCHKLKNLKIKHMCICLNKNYKIIIRIVKYFRIIIIKLNF